MFNRSVQAQFLVPMATSLAYGVLFSTLVTLLVVPSGYIVLEDLKSFLTRLFGLDQRPSQDQDKVPGEAPALEAEQAITK